MTTLDIQLRNASQSRVANASLLCTIEYLRKRGIKNVAVLGVAADGLPVLLHLRDPRPGALLITSLLPGGQRHTVTDLLDTIALSALALTANLGVAIITRRQWSLPPLKKLWLWNDDHALFQLIPAMQRGDTCQKAIVIVDDPALITDWTLFSQLCQNGPAACIWPVMAINQEPASIGRLFPTHITCLRPGTYLLPGRKQDILFSQLY